MSDINKVIIRGRAAENAVERPAKHHAGHASSRNIRRLHRPRRAQGRTHGLAHGRVLGQDGRPSAGHSQRRRQVCRGQTEDSPGMTRGKRYITEIIAGKITRDGAEREPQIERDDVPERSGG